MGFASKRPVGPPVVPFYPFFGGGSPTKIDHRKSWYPYSHLSTGGPRRSGDAQLRMRIQKAHVGVGIAGAEGREAVNAADFAIGQFRFLRRVGGEGRQSLCALRTNSLCGAGRSFF